MLKYRMVVVAISVCVLVFHLAWYRSVLIQHLVLDYNNGKQECLEDENMDVSEKGKHTAEPASFTVNKVSQTNGILELNGSFYGNDLSRIRTIQIHGLTNLVNQSNPFSEADDKLERSNLEIHGFFNVGRTVKEVNCNAIIHGDRDETKKAEAISDSKPKFGTKPEQYIKLANNCTNFISERGYITDPLTEEEKNFHIAFSILMFKDIEQSERLLKAIYRPQNSYCIHVDKKTSDDIFRAMSLIADCFENVFISSKRYDVIWATMTVLEPDLSCMKELWNKSKTWKYFINLTGQEFPLRTNYELVQILKAYNGANDVQLFLNNPNEDRWDCAGPPPHGIVPVKGSVHIVASRGYVDFILHDQRAHDFLNWTSNTVVPDETFFSTLNHNPNLGVPGAFKGYPETKMKNEIRPFVARFKNWGKDKYDWPCYGKRVRQVCVFGTGDLPRLASRRELFANKFHLDYHYFALDCIEELHFNHTRDEYTGKLVFDPQWYSQLEFVRNKIQ